MASCPDRTRRRPFVWLAVFLLAGSFWGRAAFAQDPYAQRITVSVERGGLSIDARNAPLDEVLQAIAAEAGFRLILDGRLDGMVTRSFSTARLDDGLLRLLGNTSSLLIYGAVDDAGQPTLTEVRILRGQGIRGNSGQQTMEPEEISGLDLGGTRDQRLRLARRLAGRPNPKSAKDLAVLLEQDGDATIRRLAAVGLGRTGGREAKAALLAALADEDLMVRRRAVQGLGRRWGDAAIPPLGRALLEDPKPEVRREAAVALGRMRSEAALWPLSSARDDSDGAVRQAVVAALTRLRAKGVN